MKSTVPFQIIDDDDEFDWEAAVREIDASCERANNPSSTTINQASSSNFTPPVNTLNNSSYYSCTKTGICKQSTLDKFIGIANPPVNPTVEVRHHQGNGIINSDGRPCCVEIDAEAAKTWIYPVNVPLRDYQLAITKTALFTNTLVALPTGLGKTLIAAVVMYNYFRWFPDGKIVFAAPSRPLVMQQIEACHNIVGTPQEWTIDMTGQVCPTKRACFWKTKRVFFVTPQVLEEDIQSGNIPSNAITLLTAKRICENICPAIPSYTCIFSHSEQISGTCLAKHLVCLVMDEAHRASGNYSYCVAIREISALEYRSESDPDVIPYVDDRKIELIEVALGDKFRRPPPLDLPLNRYGEIEACFGGLITPHHIRKLLSSHGIRLAYEMLEEKWKQWYLLVHSPLQHCLDHLNISFHDQFLLN
ncbi:hypothetical protein NC651_030579 [Populus alba x Populus x berolinensis]|nr:hypothetical protein NC651_030579 [Populus alba x Populus x berolinensis]